MSGELLTLSELTLELVIAVAFAAGVIVGAVAWSRPSSRVTCTRCPSGRPCWYVDCPNHKRARP